MKPSDFYSMADWLQESMAFDAACECGTDITYANEPNREYLHSDFCALYKPFPQESTDEPENP